MYFVINSIIHTFDNFFKIQFMLETISFSGW